MIIYPTPAPDLGERMAEALASLDAEALADTRRRLDAYADDPAISVVDILSLRGAAFRRLDRAARESREMRAQ